MFLIPILSIIVPVYIVELYLEKCLDSILCQTLQDYKLILVDDGSTDRSGAICDSYAWRDTRIHVIHQTNRGLSAARNAGLDASRSEYLAFVDSDDWVDEDMYEYMLRLMMEYSADMVACPIYFVNKREQVISIQHKPEHVLVLDGVDCVRTI